MSLKLLSRSTLLLLIILPILLLGGCGRNTAKNLKVGDKAPEFSAKDLNGHTIDLKSYRGKPVILRFFQPNCQYCRADTAILNKYYGKFKDKGLNIVYLDTSPTSDDLKQFVDDLHIKFPVIWDTGMNIAHKYRVKIVPQTIILNPAHEITGAILGGVGKEQLDNLLGKYLK